MCSFLLDKGYSVHGLLRHRSSNDMAEKAFLNLIGLDRAVGDYFHDGQIFRDDHRGVETRETDSASNQTDNEIA